MAERAARAVQASETALRVGELAKRTGLTVRTLHHYESIGLLTPSGRTEAGYRLYAAADVARLGQIVGLRQLGLALDEIRECLTRPGLCSPAGDCLAPGAGARADRAVAIARGNARWRSAVARTEW